mmetsp:Transcript_14321/g.18715  ORF Transcript_14321/g.18715 Transcript_14321/m.18715 type:complete len:300 (-) Transcript_14321:101-1000(-)|eukprot:CAMPEP_0198144324 /NCGR_PEP_ID=MMETSP1443-20131203/14499_1 /TAXON_ID=186043 /ORGANISM="Entomoneis sp., Strain CCMP2396" /LENGTH=299 /DNA_ID=CAMNT_0043807695 /DNA_START=95 /DNA_END=994 /DNA_ORIENTATION=+
MLRAATSKVLQQGFLSGRRGVPSAASARLQEFHVSSRRDEEAKAEAPVVAEVKESSWHPAYGIAAGITLGIPAIHYEWFLLNEETQLMACFICFVGVVHKQFGGVIQESLEADGKATLAETNKAEDMMISDLKTTIAEIGAQTGVVEDLEAVKQLKIETYKKLNETGKIKPLHDFKAQFEKLLTVIAAEETIAQEKGKQTLMKEATASVTAEFASSKDLQKKSLASAISMLKGTKTGVDPVKDTYLKFFADKKKASASVDVATEAKVFREAMITKLNSVAKNDKFYFEFDAAGKPKMVV